MSTQQFSTTLTDVIVLTLTPCILGEIPRARIGGVGGVKLAMRQVLWRQMLGDQAIAREWLLGLGRRDARERLAHLLCELEWRLSDVGLDGNEAYRLALTQAELADLLGLSPVHVNRTLRQMRGEGLIELRKKALRVVDRDDLAAVAGFDPGYLRLA